MSLSFGAPARGPMSCDCGCEYFGSQPVSQTAPDGRVFGHFSDITTPFVMLLTCTNCGRRWLYPDRMRSGGKLVDPASPQADAILAEDRIDFDKTMDVRKGKSDAPVA